MFINISRHWNSITQAEHIHAYIYRDRMLAQYRKDKEYTGIIDERPANYDKKQSVDNASNKFISEIPFVC